MGRPQYFVGLDYDQLTATGMKIVRLDYRYKFKDFMWFKLIGNMAFDVTRPLPVGDSRAARLWGAGVGILVDTPAGPLEFIYSTGSRSLLDPGSAQSEFYIVLGARF